jgi:ammonia channel protein AmtB
MANSININQSINSTVDSARATLGSNQNLQTSSSNFIQGTQTIGSTTWTALSLGSLTDVILYSVVNDNVNYTASVITIATGSVGGNIQAILTPGAQTVTPWSGSLAGLYAKVTSGYGVPTPTSGSVQWLAQQS